MDRPPGWADTLMAGRSRADKEADQDARLKALLVVGSAAALVIVALHALFSVVGLQLGWWSAPVFVPVFVWALCSAAMNRVLRPVELDGLRWPARLKGAALLAFLLWVCWGWWAGPVARAWKTAHGGFHGIASDGPRYPLHAVLGASPVMMGLVAFLLLALGMVLAPNVHRRDREPPRPPGGPEPLRAPLVSERRPPLPPRWP
ncbi:MAG: hypothetical protein ACLQBY_16955 [Solirubrobacteraceae bacterium]